MNEFELYSRILSDEFKCKNQTVLYERKSGQKASIEGKGRVDRPSWRILRPAFP